jgi:hypothetical protein
LRHPSTMRVRRVAPILDGTYLTDNMADAGVLPVSKSDRIMDRLRNYAGVLAAIAGAVTGLWGIYEKVRTDARQYTAASYETLAPQLNQMTEALKQLEQDNQRLKAALIERTRPHPVAHAKPAAPATPGAPAAASPAPGAAAAPAQPDDALGQLIGTVNRTREAVDTIRKVPDSFQKVLEQRGH